MSPASTPWVTISVRYCGHDTTFIVLNTAVTPSSIMLVTDSWRPWAHVLPPWQPMTS